MIDKYKNKELLGKYKLNPDIKIKDSIIRNNLPLINDIVNKRYNYPNFRDDLIQEGMLALSKCIDDFDPDKGEFTSFSYPAINNRMINWLFRYQHTVRVPKGKRAEFVPDDFTHLSQQAEVYESLEHSFKSLNVAERKSMQKVIFSDDPLGPLEYKASDKLKKILGKIKKDSK